MFEPLLFLIAAAFLIAGFIKGVIGLGLPTVSMGLLAVSMPPAHALAIVIVPAIITNIWQTFGGPYLRDIIRRLWPLMAGTVIGIWLNAGMLTGPYARYGTIVLGVLLVIYAIVGLSKFSLQVARRDEKWIGGIVGRTGAGARGVLHGRDHGAGLQSQQRGTPDRLDRAAGRGGDGRRLHRHVHRTGGALADAAGSLSPLVPDRDDPARDLSRGKRDLQRAGVVAAAMPGLHRLHPGIHRFLTRFC
jgi:Sulfite exporter TauE/SafE